MNTIRKATTDDCELINALALQVWEPTYGTILSREQLDYMFDMMYSVCSLREQMTGGHQYFIAYNDGEPCGYISVEQQGERLFHLQKIYVLPRFQGQGQGAYLIGEAIKYVRTLCPKGSCTIELNVNRENKARDFYERMGFCVSRSGDFSIGNGYFMNDYIMSLSL